MSSSKQLYFDSENREILKKIIPKYLGLKKFNVHKLVIGT